MTSLPIEQSLLCELTLMLHADESKCKKYFNKTTLANRAEWDGSKMRICKWLVQHVYGPGRGCEIDFSKMPRVSYSWFCGQFSPHGSLEGQTSLFLAAYTAAKRVAFRALCGWVFRGKKIHDKYLLSYFLALTLE